MPLRPTLTAIEFFMLPGTAATAVVRQFLALMMLAAR
jgi:hypothetical protein